MADVGAQISPKETHEASEKLISMVNMESIKLPYQTHEKQIKLSWKNIVVEAPDNFYDVKFLKKLTKQDELAKQKKRIIDNVDGIARSNEVLAIMGASGAGKTSLLNVLNFRNQGNLKVEGEIKVNGQLVRSVDEIASISGYVQQDDLFISCLTVKEHLLFQAMLRMDKNTTIEERLNRVEEVMLDLNLNKCGNTMIGDADKKGISGGERRRLAFASEIITNPFILFCDEPTSGLDSFMALSVVDCMRNLARKGKTILCTIHQPSSEIFEMFDKLCLLSEGRLAFIGSLSNTYDFFANALSMHQSQGYRVPINYNPADFYIKILSVSPFEKEKCLKTINEICSAFEKNELKNDLDNEISALELCNSTEIEHIDFQEEINYKTNFFCQMRWLLWRNGVSIVRNPYALRIQLLQTILISLLFGLIYFRLELDQRAVQNMNGVLFLCMTNNSFSYMLVVINTFPAEIPIFTREYQNRMYTVLSYFMSKLMVNTPIYIILPFIFTTICYWMANLNNDPVKFFICVGIIILVANTSASFGYFLSACVPNTDVAIALSGPILVPLMIFSGFLINFEDVPKYFKFMRYISWFGYANEALQINQWKDVHNLTCRGENCIQAFASGELILNYFQMSPDHFNTDINCLMFLIIGWWTLTYIVLLIKTSKR